MNRVSEVTAETPHNGSNFSSSAHMNIAHENTKETSLLRNAEQSCDDSQVALARNNTLHTAI